VWVNNDHPKPVKATVRWSLRKADAGEAAAEKTLELTLAEDSAQGGRRDRVAGAPGAGGAHRVDMSVVDDGGKTLSENVFDFIVD
jgi:hypothetical protein